MSYEVPYFSAILEGVGPGGSVAVIKDILDNQECPYNFSWTGHIGGIISNGCHNVNNLGEYF